MLLWKVTDRCGSIRFCLFLFLSFSLSPSSSLCPSPSHRPLPSPLSHSARLVKLIDGIVVSQMAERRRAATVDVQTQDDGIHALLAYCHTRPHR